MRMASPATAVMMKTTERPSVRAIGRQVTSCWSLADQNLVFFPDPLGYALWAVLTIFQ